MTTGRMQIRRKPTRGSYELADALAVLCEGLFGHLAFIQDDHPYCIPMVHGMVDETLYLHGSAASRACRIAGSGAPLCFTVTLADGVVVAKSMVNSSLNYRSCVVMGAGRPVTDPDEITVAYHAVVDSLIPGRSGDVRAPTDRELKKTAFLAMTLDEFSVKARHGGPVEEAEDVGLPHWSGVVPARIVFGAAEPAMDGQGPVPPYLDPYVRPDGGNRS
ncbi:Nitroimidazol reductase NimA, pyridoxamine 5'-phosphate oxidase superfamily [Modestobacter sp. DSM 44400]|uniref:pyridoxamine 5'-phosphate oxidase family protein n=1 Tax=Modestobacter sp. DSM 44400 TaxID=1550230 RepID=UPI00089AA8F2|nr:pyridoxamine 5'-phosphate oxidase family protein [Modestobacter sp. DSM 44400]SDY84378.1 Nitroimidazol reductase NimA, pyridoxamine 5'-phosphate oxidase superfamily [Modestobacter sp. DSM 44400]